MPQLAGRKVPIRYLVVNGLLALLLCGCGPIVRAPQFPSRAQSVETGQALGPFEGQVVDADTRQPVAEAVVSASWLFVQGVGLSSPRSSRTLEVLTDVDGRYQIPDLRDLPVGLSVRLSSLSVVVYKKGYAAYRHDREFGNGRSHRGFSQLDNLVLLSRWSPELSHARHLLFLGGGPAVRRASRWEVLAAAAELDGRTPGSRLDLPGPFAGEALPPSAPRLDASRLLSSDDIRQITGYGGPFKEDRLAGPRSETYDTYHFRAVDRPERYDVAIRLFRLGTDAELTAKYEELLAALTGSKQGDQVGDRSFTVEQGEILGLGFMDRGSSSVVLLTCGRGQCQTETTLLQMGAKVQEHLVRLPPLSPLDRPAAEPPDGDSEGGSPDEPEGETLPFPSGPDEDESGDSGSLDEDESSIQSGPPSRNALTRREPRPRAHDPMGRRSGHGL